MSDTVAGFDWDAGNWPKCGKHGVSKSEIEEVIARAKFVVDDPSPHEKRLRTVGKVDSGRYVFVVFTFRDKSEGRLVRPISARYMHRKEVENYEKGLASLE